MPLSSKTVFVLPQRVPSPPFPAWQQLYPGDEYSSASPSLDHPWPCSSSATLLHTWDSLDCLHLPQVDLWSAHGVNEEIPTHIRQGEQLALGGQGWRCAHVHQGLAGSRCVGHVSEVPVNAFGMARRPGRSPGKAFPAPVEIATSQTLSQGYWARGYDLCKSLYPGPCQR